MGSKLDHFKFSFFMGKNQTYVNFKSYSLRSLLLLIVEGAFKPNEREHEPERSVPDE